MQHCREIPGQGSWRGLIPETVGGEMTYGPSWGWDNWERRDHKKKEKNIVIISSKCITAAWVFPFLLLHLKDLLFYGLN